MYFIVKTKKFKKTFDKIYKTGLFNKITLNEFKELLDLLKEGKKLPNKNKDHQLRGELRDYRECHVKSDLLLIYRIIEDELVLLLVDIGSHSELGL